VDNLIRRQTANTPVLLGSTATFASASPDRGKCSGTRNGTKIAGANNAIYTTPANDCRRRWRALQAVVQSPQGVQTSAEVILSIFAPSVTKASV